MYEYLCRGAAMLNISPPQVTSWQLENFPMGGNFYGTIDFSHFLISAAALWALQAQALAYGELNFQFTGQTVTLGYDATSAIAAELDQLLNVVNEQFPRAKELALRQMQRGVIVGVRRQFWNQGLSRVDTLRRALDVHLNYLNMPMNTMRYPM
jgi:hypothetical protein